jgi:tetratricopeptide (TPR) repeat protein
VHVLQIGRRDEAGYFFYVMELADGLNVECEVRNAESKEAGAQKTPHSALATLDSYTPRTLRSELQARGALPPAECVALGLKLASALEHLHANGLVHRDIKPSNIIFVNGEPKLADIGLVTAIDEAQSLVGTAGYIPPEGPGTPQADLYSLGKVLYEITFGKDRQEFPQLPPDLQSHPDYTALLELNEIILKACETDPRLRYASAIALRKDLTLLGQGKSVRQERTRQRRWTACKRAGLVFSVLATVVILIFNLPHRSNRSEPSSDGPDSTNLEANALCDKAMYILRGDDFMQIAEAYTNFNRAIALDPNFARPYVGLLEIHVREASPGVPKPTVEIMRGIARHLEQLAPDLAATYVAQAVVNWSDWKYPESERCILKAIKANPNYELAHTFYSWLLCCYGRPEEAYKQVQISQSLAPSKAVIYRMFGNVYKVERDYTNAIKWYRKTFEWEPHHPPSLWGIGGSLQAMGDYTNALDYLEKADLFSGADEASTKRSYEMQRRALADGGIRGYWQLHWKWNESPTNTDYDWKGEIQIHLGNTNAALDWLEKSYATRERGDDFGTPLNDLLLNPCWDGLHENPRFKRLLDEVGYTKVMPNP